MEDGLLDLKARRRSAAPSTPGINTWELPMLATAPRARMLDAVSRHTRTTDATNREYWHSTSDIDIGSTDPCITCSGSRHSDTTLRFCSSRFSSVRPDTLHHVNLLAPADRRSRRSTTRALLASDSRLRITLESWTEASLRRRDVDLVTIQKRVLVVLFRDRRSSARHNDAFVCNERVRTKAVMRFTACPMATISSRAYSCILGLLLVPWESSTSKQASSDLSRTKW